MLAIGIICVMASIEVSYGQRAGGRLSSQSEGKSCRTVVGEGPVHSQGKFCQFPFTFLGSVRTGCISDTDPDGRLWCSTKLDSAGQHVGQAGHWGYCPPSCSDIETVQQSSNFALINNNFMRTFGLFPLSSGHSLDYDDSFDPRINNEFAAAAFRFGHSLVPKTFLSIDSNRQSKVMTLKEVFFQPKQMKAAGFFDGLLRGLMEEKSKAADSSFVDEIRNHLFEKSPNGGGLDLVALNIQRNRDHGLPGYNKYREICMGSRANTWSDLRSAILPEDISHLQQMYRSVDDVDLYVGGFLEQPHHDSLVGPVFKCIIGDQFARLKKGDRFFYDLGVEANVMFSSEELREIRKASLARLICDNSDVDRVQPFVLKLPISNTNALRSCDEESIPRLNLNVFNRNNSR